jgi:hypothetical protein
MKTVAYSEVSRSPGYVHLAYISAATESRSFLGFGMVMGMFLLLVLMAGSMLGLGGKSPRLWPVITVALLALTLLALVIGYLTVPSAPTLRHIAL